MVLPFAGCLYQRRVVLEQNLKNEREKWVHLFVIEMIQIQVLVVLKPASVLFCFVLFYLTTKL